MLKYWYWHLRHEIQSESIQDEIKLCVYWLSHDLPPYISYRALSAAKILAADNKPGVWTLDCGEIWMHYMVSCNMEQTRSLSMIACGNTQLGAGLMTGIEGNPHVHVV